jgi:hypothetical protein
MPIQERTLWARENGCIAKQEIEDRGPSDTKHQALTTAFLSHARSFLSLESAEGTEVAEDVSFGPIREKSANQANPDAMRREHPSLGSCLAMPHGCERSYGPVCQPEAWDPVKMLHIVGDQREVMGQRGGREDQVEVI